MMSPSSEPHAVSDLVAGLLAAALMRQTIRVLPFMDGMIGSAVNGAALWFASRGFGGGVHEGMRLGALGSASVAVGQVLAKTAGSDYAASRAASAWNAPLSDFAMIHGRAGELGEV